MAELDMSSTIIAKSDQLNADDLVTGPVTVRITNVTKAESGEQQVSVFITGHKPFKPCKTVLRILCGAWGKDGLKWIGRSLTLIRDPGVTWAGQKVGGIRIQAMSHITQPYEVALAESRKSKKQYVIAVLKNEDAAKLEASSTTLVEWSEKLNAATDIDALNLAAKGITDVVKAAMTPQDNHSLKLVYASRKKDFDKPDRNELPGQSDPYQALQARIHAHPTGSEASVIKVDISAALERGEITREESDELAEMLRKEMS